MYRLTARGGHQDGSQPPAPLRRRTTEGERRSSTAGRSAASTPSTARSIGWMMHMMTHLVDYAGWYNGYAEPTWVAGRPPAREVRGRAHLARLHRGDRPICQRRPRLLRVRRRSARRARGRSLVAQVPHRRAGQRRLCRGPDRQGGRAAAGARSRGTACARARAAWTTTTTCPRTSRTSPTGWTTRRRCTPATARRPCSGFQVMMAALRSGVSSGKMRLPLGPGEPELEALKRALGG